MLDCWREEAELRPTPEVAMEYFLNDKNSVSRLSTRMFLVRNLHKLILISRLVIIWICTPWNTIFKEYGLSVILT